MVSKSASLSQNGPALGGQAGEAISQVVKAGGFKHFRHLLVSLLGKPIMWLKRLTSIIYLRYQISSLFINNW
jgi:hypothetical protein